MSEFKKQKEALTVLALCFAEASETYHHWRVFSHGSDGVCLEFDRASLLAAFKNDPLIQSRNVLYRKIDAAVNSGISTDDLPFCKRLPYEDEKELRIVYVDMKSEHQFKDVPISLGCITRVTLSPWLPKALSNAVKKTIKEIKGCDKLKVFRSTLIQNERWMKAANPLLE